MGLLDSIRNYLSQAGDTLNREVVQPVGNTFQRVVMPTAQGFVSRLPQMPGQAMNSLRNTLNTPAPRILQNTLGQLPDPASFTRALGNTPTVNISQNIQNPLGRLAVGLGEGIINQPANIMRSYGRSATDIMTGAPMEQTLGHVGGLGLDLASMVPMAQGVNLARNASRTVLTRAPQLSQLIGQGANTGLKYGLGYGAGYGVTGAMAENQGLGDVALSGITGAAMGGLTGGLLGGAIPAASGAYSALKHDIAAMRGRNFGPVDTIPEHLVPGMENIRGIDFYGRNIPKQSFDPNAPVSPEAFRQIGSAMPRPGMSIQDVSGGKASAPKQLALPQGQSPLALPNARGYASGEGFQMSPGSRNKTAKDLRVFNPTVKGNVPGEKTVPITRNYTAQPGNEPQTMGAIRRFFTGGDTVLNKSGKGGQELAQMMGDQRKQEDLLRGQWNVHIDKALNGLSKKQLDNVDAVLRGEAKPIDAQTAGAAKSLRNWFDSIGKTAEQMEFQVQTSDGVKVPFKMQPDYAPQMYNFTELQNGVQREKALAHLVDTGQARNLAEATKLLDNFIKKGGERRVGNLEKAREINLPGFERDPRIYAKKYAQSIAKRFTEVNNFGMKDALAAKKIDRIAQEGGDYNSAQNIFDYTTKGADQNKVVNALTQYNLATQLDLSAITNATQSLNTATKAGVWNTVKGAAKGFTKEGKEISALAGVDDDFIHSKETGVDLNKVVAAVMWPFKQVEGFNRRTAANAGVYQAKELAAKKEMSDYAIRELQSLGIDPSTIKNGRLSKEQMLSAAYEMTRKTQFKVDPLDVPTAWKTPAGKLVTQFQSFSFMQTKFIRDEILKEAAKGNLAPLVRFIPLAIAGSYAANYVRNLATGRDPEEANKNMDIRAWDKWGRAFGDFATAKIIQAKFLADTYSNDYNTPLTKVTRTLSSVLGPTIGKAGSVLTALESMQSGIESNNKKQLSIAKGTAEAVDPMLSLKRFAAGEVPVVGEYMKNTAFAFPASKYSPQEKAQFARDQAVSDAKVVNIELTRGKITPEEAQQKMQAIQDTYTRDVATINEKAASNQVVQTSNAQSKPSVGDNRIQYNPVSGQYNYFDSNGNYASAKTEQKAKQAIAKSDFESSDKNFQDLSNTLGVVFRKTTGGEVQTMTKDAYSTRLLTAKMDEATAAKDASAWMGYAKQQFQALENQLKDPNVDELDKMDIQKKITALVKKAVTVQKKGFGSSGKKGKKPPAMPKMKALAVGLSKTTRTDISGSKARKTKQLTLKDLYAMQKQIALPKVSK